MSEENSFHEPVAPLGGPLGPLPMSRRQQHDQRLKASTLEEISGLLDESRNLQLKFDRSLNERRKLRDQQLDIQHDIHGELTERRVPHEPQEWTPIAPVTTQQTDPQKYRTPIPSRETILHRITQTVYSLFDEWEALVPQIQDVEATITDLHKRQHKLDDRIWELLNHHSHPDYYADRAIRSRSPLGRKVRGDAARQRDATSPIIKPSQIGLASQQIWSGDAVPIMDSLEMTLMGPLFSEAIASGASSSQTIHDSGETIKPSDIALMSGGLLLDDDGSYPSKMTENEQ